ncbi:MAG: hypothetical protein ABIG44_04385 [Planctomycetota bacterium]
MSTSTRQTSGLSNMTLRSRWVAALVLVGLLPFTSGVLNALHRMSAAHKPPLATCGHGCHDAKTPPSHPKSPAPHDSNHCSICIHLLAATKATIEVAPLISTGLDYVIRFIPPDAPSPPATVLRSPALPRAPPTL